MNFDLFKTETAQMVARKSVTGLAAILVERGITMSKDWYGAAQEIIAGLVVFAISWALSRWNVNRKVAVIENLQTVVDTKVAETQVLHAVVADSHAETGVLINALLEARVPIPELPPVKLSIPADLVVDIQPNNLSKP